MFNVKNSQTRFTEKFSFTHLKFSTWYGVLGTIFQKIFKFQASNTTSYNLPSASRIDTIKSHSTYSHGRKKNPEKLYVAHATKR